MDSTCCKSGFLQKAGKRTFQAWRKRWFVLGNNVLKYYSPAEEYNDSNQLGSIQMVEIQSVKPSKDKKHGFVIITRSRTYNVSAKSDMERDDWIISIRNTSSNQRRSKPDTEVSSPSIYDEIGSSSASNNANPCGSSAIYAEIYDPKPMVNNEVQNNGNTIAIYDQIGDASSKVTPPVSKIPPIVKPRAQTDLTTTTVPIAKPRAKSDLTTTTVPIVKPQAKSDLTTTTTVPIAKTRAKSDRITTTVPIVKPRAKSDLITTVPNYTPQKPRAFSAGNLIVENLSGSSQMNSVLKNMSIIESPNEEMEFIYQEIDKDLDKGGFGSDDDVGEEDEADESVSNMIIEFSLPKPRDGSQSYAFDEIKHLAKTWGDCCRTQLDLHEIAKSKNLNITEKEEYPVIMVLKSYLNGNVF